MPVFELIAGTFQEGESIRSSIPVGRGPFAPATLEPSQMEHVALCSYG